MNSTRDMTLLTLYTEFTPQCTVHTIKFYVYKGPTALYSQKFNLARQMLGDSMVSIKTRTLY